MSDWQKDLGNKFNRPNEQDRGRNNPNPMINELNSDLIITSSFYDSSGYLKEELFYKNPETIAKDFQNYGLKSSALRNIYNSYLKFALRLKDGRITFEKAKEQFDIFYEERIIRQANRKESNSSRPLLPGVVASFFEKHRDLARKDEKEMLGLFRYLTNIMCHFKG